MKPKLGKLFICSLFIFTIILFNFPFTVLAVGSQVLKDSDRFIWIGKKHTRFSEEELQYIAQNYSFVVFERMHAGRRMELQHQDARRLKELKPNLKVLVYFSMSYRFIIENDRYGGEEFASHEEWYLHDKDNQKIPHKNWKSGEVVGYWVDLSVPSYRQWVRQTIRQWIIDGGYDGVAFDSVKKLAGSYWEFLGPNWQEKINEWNKGVDYLFQGVRADLGENKLIIFNGIHRSSRRIGRDGTRNESILYSSSISGSLYEYFCYRGYNAKQFQTKVHALKDVEFIYNSAKNYKKIILAKVLYGADFEPTEQEIVQYSRYCFGLFLLSHVPGYTKFKFGPTYYISNQDKKELYQNALEINLPLDNPQGKYYQSSSFYQRNFQNGLVVVNLEDSDKVWVAPEKLELWNEGKYQRTLKKGDAFTLKVHDAAFLLKPNTAPTPTPTANPADLNQDGKVDIYDYNILVADFGKTGSPGWIKADIIKDGKVDIFDYNVLVENFGK